MAHTLPHGFAWLRYQLKNGPASH